MAGPHLKWIDSHGVEHVRVLTGNDVLIGRKSDADIILAAMSVSRHHARLVGGKDGYSIADLSNTNGTYVNGQRIKQQRLRDGDRICLGQDRVELYYFTGAAASTSTVAGSAAEDLEKSFASLSLILPTGSSEHSDLEKISSILDFQYQLGKVFSAEKTFEQILKSALKISGAERGYILLKEKDRFEYVAGMNERGEQLRQSEFSASRSVVRQVANNGKPIYMAGGIGGEFAEMQSIVILNIRSLAAIPLRWMLPESDTPEVRGVLYLDSTRSMRELSGLDEKILNKLALEAGNVFEKLQMIKTFEERKSLQLELALAQETQKNLQNELRAAEELRRAESQVLLAENAASMGRFAAALSHELNSPLGVLKSALQTCNTLAEKKPALPVEKRREVEEIEVRLRESAMESAERLHQIVLRMQRFTNMDRNEIVSVDLNSLLQDVTDVLQSQIKDTVRLEIGFQPLPRILVRPQQIGAVFSNLLHNAVEGLAAGGHVWLLSSLTDSHVEVTVRDNGGGISPEDLANIFEPAFKVRAGRVSTGNWGLFSCRQIIREHGGEIEIQSTLGQGTTVRVTLPAVKSEK
jgi:signal transduction histidine kinase